MPFAAELVPPLRPVFESRDPDATRVFMLDREFCLDLHPRETGAFDFSASAVYLPNSYIGCIGYGSAVTVRVPAGRRRDDYFVHLPVLGCSEVTNHAGSAECAPRRAVISSPDGHVTRAQAGSVRITLSLNKTAMRRQLAALLNDTPIRALDFAPEIDLEAPGGRRMSRHVQLAIAELDDAAQSPPNPIMQNQYEQLIMNGLLLGQPNSYTDALARLERRAEPRDVRKAIDYMNSRLEDPITLADIVAVSGLPGRTLLKHFQDHYGTSPMRYLRNARLQRVRNALTVAQSGEGVTQIAMSFGFTHLGRFALEYRRRFGETPSETYRRRRGLKA